MTEQYCSTNILVLITFNQPVCHLIIKCSNIQGIVREVTVTRNRNETYGFILRFDQNEGLVEISGIDSGSPAAKIGKICIGDKIWAINHKRMQGKTLSILKKVRKWVKHFASSITFHLITNQYNGKSHNQIFGVR